MNGVRTLHPAYFALVMATGIVSIAAKLMGMSVVAWALLVVFVTLALDFSLLVVVGFLDPGAFVLGTPLLMIAFAVQGLLVVLGVGLFVGVGVVPVSHDGFPP